MTNRPPAFMLYASDFLSDENVMTMTNQEVGCYIKLLLIEWIEGSIPDNIKKIGRLCGEPEDIMAQLWLAIEPCFQKNPKTGRLLNRRLEVERKKLMKYKQQRTEAGKKGASKRWKYRKNKPKQSHSSSNGQAMAKPLPSQGVANGLPLAKNSISSSISSTKDLSKDKSANADFSNNHYREKLGKYLEGIKSKISEIEVLTKKTGRSFNVHQWVQIQVNESKHPKAISETLGGVIDYWNKIEKDPWSMAEGIMITKSGKYHAEDHRKESEQFKNIYVADPEIKKLIESIF